MVKNIILDVGGILFDDSKENIEKLLGKDCDYIYKITYDKTFKKCLLGETSVQDYINDFKDNKEFTTIKYILEKDNFNIDNKKLKDKVYIKNSFTYPLTNEEKEHIMIDTKVDTSIKKGKIGYMSIKLYNKEIGNIKIYLKEKKSQKKRLFGFLNR